MSVPSSPSRLATPCRTFSFDFKYLQKCLVFCLIWLGSTKQCHLSGITRKASIGIFLPRLSEVPNCLSRPVHGANTVNYRVSSLSCLHALSANYVDVHRFHAGLDEVVSIQDVKALLCAEVVRPNRCHGHLLNYLANWIVVTGLVSGRLKPESKLGPVLSLPCDGGACWLPQWQMSGGSQSVWRLVEGVQSMLWLFGLFFVLTLVMSPFQNANKSGKHCKNI